MKDTIYREDAIESMAKAIWNYPKELYPCLKSYEHAHDLAEQGLKFMPSAEPERKKGKWTIKIGELAIWDVCSECKKMVIHKAPFYNYCPNCGADMRGEQE